MANWTSRACLGVLLLPATGGCQSSRPAPPDPDGPVVACERYPDQASSPYILPYPIDSGYVVWRSTSHYAPGNGGVGLHAIDFDMPIGSPVVAARAGIVVAARDSFPDGNNVDLAENLVFIQHDDGTVARYFHLREGGVLVQIGDTVSQGQLLGASGNSGQSTGPHLHFDVQRCGPNLPPNYNAAPCGQTLPVVFRNTAAHPCGVVVGRLYRATAP
jgi:murein DD-endopeptidase MepM/ murein hydrolase activator NlpD